MGCQLAIHLFPLKAAPSSAYVILISPFWHMNKIRNIKLENAFVHQNKQLNFNCYLVIFLLKKVIPNPSFPQGMTLLQVGVVSVLIEDALHMMHSSIAKASPHLHFAIIIFKTTHLNF